MIFDMERLARYRDLGYNVLMTGHAGVGKTHAIMQAFGSLNWKYFSAPTMDPWVDLVGVPRAVEDKERGGHVLELVRPEFVKAGEVQAIFIDELNRAPDKVLNALLELLQFKTINGAKFPNLRCIWAAVNPDEEEGDYAVNRLDRAIRDRFQVQLRIKYDVDAEYFDAKYPDTGAAFVSWWRNLAPQMQHAISPRRLDALADAYQNGCHLQDFVPEGTNISSLKQTLIALPFNEQLAQVTSAAAAQRFLKDINNATRLLRLITSRDQTALDFYERYKHVMPRELVDALAPQVLAIADNARTTTLTALLPELNSLGNIGDPEITRVLNLCAFVYTDGETTLRSEVKRLLDGGNRHLSKLASHILHVMTKLSGDELKAAMVSKTTCKPMPLTLVAMEIAVLDTEFKVFSKDERKRINGHTYLEGAASGKWMPIK